MLEFLNVEKTYDGRKILDITGLQLVQGIYWLQGANGCGKTTLLRMISGIIPFSGDIIHEEISLKKNSTKYRRRIGWSDAEPEFLPFLSGHELVSFYSYVRKASKSQTEKLISFLEADKFLNQKIETYSSGMKKKFSILLAFIGEPSLILLDEPLSTLDSDSTLLIMKLILDIHQEFGTNFLLSSHHDMSRDFLVMPKKLLLANKSIMVSL
jgi:ABC-2 type transport system ATP-binding protein